MAELEIRQPEESIYSNVEEKEVLPLFIRYSSKNVEFHDKTSSVPFDNIVAMLSGVHTCVFIHRKQKGRNAKEYDELSIKVDDESFCMTAQLSRDEFTLQWPRFNQKNMVLPEEEEQYIVRKCEIKFVDQFEDTLKLFNSAGSYWVGHTNDVKEFIASCFALPIPPIEIRIEEDKEMWQAYLDGLNAILENKRDLIKISSVHNQKGGLIKLVFDMESYGENLKNAIIEKLSSQCEQKFDVEIGNGECHISFDSYQAISEEIIEDIKAIGRDYCYTSEANPENVVSGKIAIVSNPDELNSILSAIDQELHDFGTHIERTDSGEFKLSSDKDFEFLRKIVETNHKGIAEVVPTTKMIMRLVPSPEGIDIEKIKAWLPDTANIVPHGKHFVVSSKKPLDTSLDVFKNLQFASCMVSISPSKSIDTTIAIEGATIKGNAYQWIINDFHELNGLGRLFNEVRKVYTDKKYILIDPIRSDDKLVGFNTKSVIKNIIVNKSPLPVLFSNVEMTLVKFEGQMYNKVVILGEGTAINRRENFRVFVGEGITFKFKSRLEEYHAILKDISVGGFALVLNNPNDYVANYQVGEALQFVFESIAGTTNVSLKIHGVVVRVAQQDTKIILGCKMSGIPMGLRTYVNEKQRESLANKEL